MLEQLLWDPSSAHFYSNIMGGLADNLSNLCSFWRERAARGLLDELKSAPVG